MTLFIGENLRRERETKGYNKQYLFAEMAHMSQSNLSKIEANQQPASWEQVERFANLLGIPPQRLTGDTSPAMYGSYQNGSEPNNGYSYIPHLGSEVESIKTHVHTSDQKFDFFIQQLNSKFDIFQKHNDILVSGLRDRIQVQEEEIRYWRERYQL